MCASFPVAAGHLGVTQVWVPGMPACGSKCIDAAMCDLQSLGASQTLIGVAAPKLPAMHHAVRSNVHRLFIVPLLVPPLAMLSCLLHTG